MNNNKQQRELTPDERALFQKCLELAMQFAHDHTSGIAFQYMQIREQISDSGLDEQYKAWFFGEK